MIRFSWKEVSILQTIEGVGDSKLRRRLRRAYNCLMGLRDSNYADFVRAHDAFLDKHGDGVEPRLRKRWARFLETEGVETALWPCVFYKRDMCFTVERAGNPDRKPGATLCELWSGADNRDAYAGD